jgi:hypothetical protein
MLENQGSFQVDQNGPWTNISYAQSYINLRVKWHNQVRAWSPDDGRSLKHSQSLRASGV